MWKLIFQVLYRKLNLLIANYEPRSERFKDHKIITNISKNANWLDIFMENNIVEIWECLFLNKDALVYGIMWIRISNRDLMFGKRADVPKYRIGI